MEGDLDYDRAWEKVGQQFWHRRRRELRLHIALFVIVQLLVFALIPNVGMLEFHVGYPIFGLLYLNWVYIPWISIYWTVVLLIHLAAVIGAVFAVRTFRYGVERELLRQHYEATPLREKRKMRPAHDQPGNDVDLKLLGDAEEHAYRQSAH